MTIYEIIGMFFVVYFCTTGIAAHLIVLHHGQKRIAERNRTGQLHEFEAEKTLAEMRHPTIR